MLNLSTVICFIGIDFCRYDVAQLPAAEVKMLDQFCDTSKFDHRNALFGIFLWL